MKQTNRNGTIRFYDATSVTPFYLPVEFSAGDFSGPLGVPLADEMIQLDRGQIDANSHYITGSEDKIMEPSQISLSAFVRDDANFQGLLELINVLNGDGTTVNSNTLVTTKATTARDGVTTTPAFADSNKKAVNVEILFDTAGTDFGIQYNEVFFPLAECTFTETEDGNTIALTGYCYGSIDNTLTAFTTGASFLA